jgi:SpoVK/Ycf46/Vps4 family AAA+-type ATPase
MSVTELGSRRVRPEDGSPARARVLAASLRHAALLVERLVFLGRNLGLVPRTSLADDPLGPVVVSDEDVRTMLAGLRRSPDADGSPPAPDPFEEQLAGSRAALLETLRVPDAAGLGLAGLVRGLALGDGEVEALVLALAPDWDARFGRLFGFLNNDATRQRPTLTHLRLAVGGASAPTSAGARAATDRLLALGLIALERSADAPAASRTVLAPTHVVELSDAEVTAGEPAESPPPTWDALHWPNDEKQELATSLLRELGGRVAERPPLVLLEGPPGSGRSSAARAAAAQANLGVVVCDLPALARGSTRDLEQELAGAFLRAAIEQALLIVRSDGILKETPEALARLVGLADRQPVRCFVLVRRDELSTVDLELPFVRIELPAARAPERRRIWADALGARGLTAPDELLDEVSARYDLTPGRILDLVEELGARSEWTGEKTFGVREARDSLQAITTLRLMDLATFFHADVTLDELVFPPAVRERLDELIHRVRHRYTVLSEWRFGHGSTRGHGVSALFSGPPGTGKTAAAGAVAQALEINLYVINLSSIMSKWVGETEENLARVFDEAEASSVALLFDEADSLFGKRSAEMRSANDRFANITINYLLQRMETYGGLAILTTNLESAIDTAFSRRITNRVVFPAPDYEYRIRLWRELLPERARYADDVDLESLARQFELPGARVKSALARAAFRAVASGRREPLLAQEDLVWAAENEYKDMGLLASRRGP